MHRWEARHDPCASQTRTARDCRRGGGYRARRRRRGQLRGDVVFAVRPADGSQGRDGCCHTAICAFPLPDQAALARPPAPGTPFRSPGPPGALGFGPFGAIHGQFVAPKPGGGYQTIDAQRGTVTAVSTGSITVHSGDGYTKTYQVTSTTHVDAHRAGIGSVKTGQTVSVLATVNGSSATATQIVDFAALPNPPKVPKTLTPGSRHVLRFGPCASWSISR